MEPGGGSKKFLYTGTKREPAEEEWNFAPKAQPINKSTGVPVDLDDVWSIQRNVSLGGLAPRAADRLQKNAGQGFYSRHGGPGGKVMRPSMFPHNGAKNQKPPEKSDVGSAWAPARGSSFSYSYTAGHNQGDDTSSIASSRMSRGYHSNPSPRRYDNKGRPMDENDF